MSDNRKKLGNWGEQKAQDYLLGLGYSLLERNWRNRFGEIDLIMIDKDVVVFIEVRTKSNSSFGTGIESITARKLYQLRKMATSYLQHKDYWDKAIRFDLITIDNKDNQWLINHDKNILD